MLERLLHLFPTADIFTHVYVPAAVSPAIRKHSIRTTFINQLPAAARLYQRYLPLMPLALEQLDLRGYDLVISSEAGPAKGVIAPPDALHLCYCHSPMRYLWDHYPEYRENAGWLTRKAMPLVFRRLRDWDVVSASRVDRIAANSHFVQRRIRRAWGRESSIVHPPVAVDLFKPAETVENRFLWVGQMVPYKRPDLAVAAFNELRLPLLMVGDGEMAPVLRRMAGPTITIVPKLPFDELRRAYAASRALIFTAQEDFGIVPVEMMAAGRPVIAFGSGGVLDTVIPGETGLFFQQQSPASLIDAVSAFEAWLPSFDPTAAITRARAFAPAAFDSRLTALLGSH